MGVERVAQVFKLASSSYENWATLINFKLAPAGPHATVAWTMNGALL